MDEWFKDILPDKDPYHNRGRDQMRKKGGPDFKCLWYLPVSVPVLQILEDTGITRIVVPVSRPAASYYPN
jgi:hypothetical protein